MTSGEMYDYYVRLNEIRDDLFFQLTGRKTEEMVAEAMMTGVRFTFEPKTHAEAYSLLFHKAFSILLGAWGGAVGEGDPGDLEAITTYLEMIASNYLTSAGQVIPRSPDHRKKK